MKLSTYTYSGPRSAVSLHIEGQVLDVALIPGGTAQLPPEHDYTRSLLALGHIHPEPSRSTKPPAPATAPSSTAQNGEK